MGQRGARVMASLKRKAVVFLGSRHKLRWVARSPTLLLLLCLVLAASCVLHLVASRRDNGVSSELFPEKESVIIETPSLPLRSSTEKKEELDRELDSVQSDNKLQNVYIPPLSEVSNNDVKELKQREQYDYDEAMGENVNSDSIFGNVQININADEDSFLGKVINLAGNADGSSILKSVWNVAKELNSLSSKVSPTQEKIADKKLQQVQRFVSSAETKPGSETLSIPDPPLGPEARKSDEFEKQMQRADDRPSLLQSISQHVAPAILSGVAKGAEDLNRNSSAGSGGASLLENVFVNIGPKIIADVFGGERSGGGQESGTTGGMNRFSNGLKLLTPLLNTFVGAQDGTQGNVNSAIGPLMGAVGGLVPLFNGKNKGNESSFKESWSVLKPVLGAMGPSIMKKIFNKKIEKKPQRERRNKESSAEVHANVTLQDSVTIVDRMLHGMDEKTVGQAVGRVLTNVMVKALPETLPLPNPTDIRKPYNMALNIVMGHPRNSSKVMWDWLRQVSGNYQDDGEESNTNYLDWVNTALANPKRATYKEDIRHLYGLLRNVEAGCRNIQHLGGVYDWKEDRILGSRTVCEDFDLWKAPTRRVLSFGLNRGWTFEEEVAKRENSQVYVVEPTLGEMDFNRTYNIAYYHGALGVEEGQRRDVGSKVVQVHTFTSWLKRWQLEKTQLHYVKLDMGGEEWQMLQWLLNNGTNHLEEVEQLSVTVHMDEALKNPRLYAEYVEVLDSLASLGFQLVNVAIEETKDRDSVLGGGRQTYQEPLLGRRELAMQYQLSFVRI